MFRMRSDSDPSKRAEYLLKKKYKDDIVHQAVNSARSLQKVQGHNARVNVDLTFLGGNYGGGSTARDALSKHAKVHVLLSAGCPRGQQGTCRTGK